MSLANLLHFFPIAATVSAACVTEAVNKLAPKPLDGSVFPSWVHRLYRTFMSHYSQYSSLCPNKSRELCRDDLDSNESFCWHFHFTDTNNEAKLPHLATQWESDPSGELFAQAWQRSLCAAGVSHSRLCCEWQWRMKPFVSFYHYNYIY